MWPHTLLRKPVTAIEAASDLCTITGCTSASIRSHSAANWTVQCCQAQFSLSNAAVKGKAVCWNFASPGSVKDQARTKLCKEKGRADADCSHKSFMSACSDKGNGSAIIPVWGKRCLKLFFWRRPWNRSCANYELPTPQNGGRDGKILSKIFKYLFCWSGMKKRHRTTARARRDLPCSLEPWRYFEVIYTHLFHVVSAHNPFLLPLEPRQNKAATNSKEEMSTYTDGIKPKQYTL